MPNINKAIKLTKLIEDLIDPQQPYPKGDVANSGLNPREREWSNSTHHKLVKESMRHIDQSSDEGDKAYAIKNYTGSGYGSINNHLRHQSPLEYNHEKSVITNLKSLTQHPTEHTFTVYRGSKGKLFDHTPGSTFKDHGFTSTSLRPSIATRFASRDHSGKPIPDDQEKHMYRIHVTPGTKGHYVSGHKVVGSDNEREFVLHPGTTFKVGEKHHHESGHTYTDLHIHSQEE